MQASGLVYLSRGGSSSTTEDWLKPGAGSRAVVLPSLRASPRELFRAKREDEREKEDGNGDLGVSDIDQATHKLRANRNLRIKFGLEQGGEGDGSEQSRRDTGLGALLSHSFDSETALSHSLHRSHPASTTMCRGEPHDSTRLGCEAFAFFLKQKFTLQISPCTAMLVQLKSPIEHDDVCLEDRRRKIWRERL